MNSVGLAPPAPEPVSPRPDSPAGEPSHDTAEDQRPSAIRFDDVGKQFDERWIVRGLNVDVRAGTILGLVGPSGCGKTTTVRLATGVYRPDEGRVVVLGADPSSGPTRRRTAIGYLPQAPALFDDLSLWENLNFHASLNGVPWRRRQRLDDVLALVELTGEERKVVRDASGGMRRRLALAATLVHDPPLLILDEPTAGIDPLLRRQIWDHFRQLRDEGKTVVVTTQHVNEAAHCDVVVVLDEGRVVAIGSPAELRRRAFGGDVIAITLASSVGEHVLAALDEMGCAQVDVIDRSRLRLVVDQAPTDLPLIMRHLDEAGIGVKESSEVPVDWDEAFIALVGPRERE